MIIIAFLTINIIFIEDVEEILINKNIRELFEAVNHPETGLWFNTSVDLYDNAHIISIVIDNSLSSHYLFIAY